MKSSFEYVFWHEEESAITALQYRKASLPWPLSPRDFMTVLECILVKGDGDLEVKDDYPTFVLYNVSVKRSERKER